MIQKPIILDNSQEWKKYRGLGGSSASVVVAGDSIYLTIQELYDYIANNKPLPDTTSNFATYGKEQEKFIRDNFLETLKDVYELDFYNEFAIFTHPLYSKITASLDGVVKDKLTGELFLLEVKTRQVQNKDEWDFWHASIRNIKENYIIQVAHYLNVCPELVGATILIELNYLDKKEVVGRYFTREELQLLCDYVLNRELEFLLACESHTRPAIDLFNVREKELAKIYKATHLEVF